MKTKIKRLPPTKPTKHCLVRIVENNLILHKLLCINKEKRSLIDPRYRMKNLNFTCKSKTNFFVRIVESKATSRRYTIQTVN